MFHEGIGPIALTTVLGGLFQPRLSAFDRRSCRSHQVGTSGRLSGDSRKRPRQNSTAFSRLVEKEIAGFVPPPGFD
jgi:hypothetical protein